MRNRGAGVECVTGLSLWSVFRPGTRSVPLRRAGSGTNLTAEQQAELQKLRQDFADQTRELREGLQAKRQEMRTLMESSSPDKKELKRVQAEINTLRAQLADARIDHVLKVKEINPQAFSGYGRGCGISAWKGCPRSGFGERQNRRAYCPNAL